MLFMMKMKIFIIALFFSMLLLNNFNQTYADNHTLKSLLKKKKNKSNNTISGSTSNNSSKNTPSLKKCDKKIATLAVVEPQDYEMLALMQYSLPSPTSLIRLIVQQSNCFIVDNKLAYITDVSDIYRKDFYHYFITGVFMYSCNASGSNIVPSFC